MAYLDKTYTISKLLPILDLLKSQGKKVVFTNGCFDILHLGHVQYLEEAKGLGDYLVVGINSDASVERLKGSNRPIQNMTSRIGIIASLHMVDAVVGFDNDTPLDLITAIKPDILVKGGDWQVSQIVGGAFVIENGGEVHNLTFLKDHSTTGIEQKIKNS